MKTFLYNERIVLQYLPCDCATLDMDGNDIEPIVEIFTELLFLDHLLQVLIGRSNDPYINIDKLV